ncbi:MAG: ribosome silencing factor [Phycisphaerae bacterium]|nr:ribosome silencing factor [Phycisphaerae bacterium]
MIRSRSSTDPEKVRAFAIEVARHLHDRKFEDVRVLDVRGASPVCDYVVLGSGTSSRQMKSTATEIEKIGKAQGFGSLGESRDPSISWVVVDFVDVVAHLFEPNQRAYYDLEQLWQGAPSVPWRRGTA